ncbi:hypothetical protein [Thiomicrorhabdus sp.]|uniref:hypothetical protein n=1 Tax=Thiomicrorhabdus sp. TaxID=2039724 RepID=UPI0029C7257B|nr:hypothetical protein [Thiomicrorhabdus sp.]
MFYFEFVSKMWPFAGRPAVAFLSVGEGKHGNWNAAGRCGVLFDLFDFQTSSVLEIAAFSHVQNFWVGVSAGWSGFPVAQYAGGSRCLHLYDLEHGGFDFIAVYRCPVFPEQSGEIL